MSFDLSPLLLPLDPQPSSSTPSSSFSPQLQLSLAPTSFKRSFEQFGLDTTGEDGDEVMLDGDSSDRQGEGNVHKRARSASARQAAESSSSNALAGPSGSRSHSLTNGRDSLSEPSSSGSSSHSTGTSASGSSNLSATRPSFLSPRSSTPPRLTVDLDVPPLDIFAGRPSPPPSPPPATRITPPVPPPLSAFEGSIAALRRTPPPEPSLPPLPSDSWDSFFANLAPPPPPPLPPLPSRPTQRLSWRPMHASSDEGEREDEEIRTYLGFNSSHIMNTISRIPHAIPTSQPEPRGNEPAAARSSFPSFPRHLDLGPPSPPAHDESSNTLASPVRPVEDHDRNVRSRPNLYTRWRSNFNSQDPAPNRPEQSRGRPRVPLPRRSNPLVEYSDEEDEVILFDGPQLPSPQVNRRTAHALNSDPSSLLGSDFGLSSPSSVELEHERARRQLIRARERAHRDRLARERAAREASQDSRETTHEQPPSNASALPRFAPIPLPSSTSYNPLRPLANQQSGRFFDRSSQEPTTQSFSDGLVGDRRPTRLPLVTNSRTLRSTSDRDLLRLLQRESEIDPELAAERSARRSWINERSYDSNGVETSGPSPQAQPFEFLGPRPNRPSFGLADRNTPSSGTSSSLGRLSTNGHPPFFGSSSPPGDDGDQDPVFDNWLQGRALSSTRWPSRPPPPLPRPNFRQQLPSSGRSFDDWSSDYSAPRRPGPSSNNAETGSMSRNSHLSRWNLELPFNPLRSGMTSSTVPTSSEAAALFASRPESPDSFVTAVASPDMPFAAPLPDTSRGSPDEDSWPARLDDSHFLGLRPRLADYPRRPVSPRDTRPSNRFSLPHNTSERPEPMPLRRARVPAPPPVLPPLPFEDTSLTSRRGRSQDTSMPYSFDEDDVRPSSSNLGPRRISMGVVFPPPPLAMNEDRPSAHLSRSERRQRELQELRDYRLMLSRDVERSLNDRDRERGLLDSSPDSSPWESSEFRRRRSGQRDVGNTETGSPLERRRPPSLRRRSPPPPLFGAFSHVPPPPLPTVAPTLDDERRRREGPGAPPMPPEEGHGRSRVRQWMRRRRFGSSNDSLGEEGFGFSLFGPRRNLGDYISDADFDASYENLLSLAAALGDAKPRGTPANVISSLPKGLYKDWYSEGSDTRCPICLDDYMPSDTCMKLPDCSHWFHDGCLQQWLQGAHSCPVCRHDIDFGPSGSNNGVPPDNGPVPGPSRRRREGPFWRRFSSDGQD